MNRLAFGGDVEDMMAAGMTRADAEAAAGAAAKGWDPNTRVQSMSQSSAANLTASGKAVTSSGFQAQLQKNKIIMIAGFGLVAVIGLLLLMRR